MVEVTGNAPGCDQIILILTSCPPESVSISTKLSGFFKKCLFGQVGIVSAPHFDQDSRQTLMS